jgi:NAD(P)-dependent dehydrogenase (short-subunit alcohol dehydrogenase family)
MSGIVVVGAGPGIGQAVALRFARAGFDIALIARTKETVSRVAEVVSTQDVAVFPLVADSTEEETLHSALDAVQNEFGIPDVVVYSAALIQSDALGEILARDHLDAWAVNVVGAITTATHTLPEMATRGSGTFIVTGGMPTSHPEHLSLSLGKAGVRTLLSMLDTEFAPSGVHVATVAIDGPVARGTAFDPDLIAEHYWRLHQEPRHTWTHEIVHSASGHQAR